MGVIKIEGMRFRANHGCMPEEAIVGGMYVVDVMAVTDFSKAAKDDDLTQTIDYCTVYEIVKAEMGIRSKLIEHVAQRILDQMVKTFSTVLEHAEVKVTKLNPPIKGDVSHVSVIVALWLEHQPTFKANWIS